MHLPLAAASEADLAGVLVDLFVILLAAKLGDELFKRLGQPGIVGEIVAGVLIGPSVLGLVSPGEVFQVFAELGVVFLLFWVGLETRLSDMRAVGSSAALVGGLGVVLPFAGGIGLGFALGDGSAEAIFLGVALTATSVGITSAVLIELGVLPASQPHDPRRGGDRRRARGAAARGRDRPGRRRRPRRRRPRARAGDRDRLPRLLRARRHARDAALAARAARAEVLRVPLLPAVLVCLGLAALAAKVGLAAVIGAFLAGMIVAETRVQHPIEREVEPLYAFFPPFFFAFIGAAGDLGALADGGALLLLAGLTALAVGDEVRGRLARRAEPRKTRPQGRRARDDPARRGGVVVAGIGASAGVIGDERFAVIVAMSVATTLIAPPLLRRALRD